MYGDHYWSGLYHWPPLVECHVTEKLVDIQHKILRGRRRGVFIFFDASNWDKMSKNMFMIMGAGTEVYAY